MAISNDEEDALKSNVQRHNSSSAIKGVQRRRQHTDIYAQKRTYIHTEVHT
jgi:hypothetical protein